jgi:hypothetical protein
MVLPALWWPQVLLEGGEKAQHGSDEGDWAAA